MNTCNPRWASPLLVLLGTLGAAPAARAGDAIFTHTYLAETLPQGAMEVEQWVTHRTKKSQGTYDLWQTRTEFEYGLTDRWTVSAYANFYRVNARNNNSIASRNNFTAVGDGDEVSGGGPVTFGPYVPHAEQLPLPSSRYRESEFESVSLESIYQFLSPFKDGIGLAAYVEGTAGSKTRELELKLLVQKNLMGDDLVLAGNLAVEIEREEWSGLPQPEKEAKLVLSGGASYRFAPGWRAGVELRNERAYEGAYSLANRYRDYSAWYAGPTLHYAGLVGGKGFFVTAGYQQQLPWARAYSQASEVELVD
ncbi:MAG: hypothetical protein Q8L12_13105, partial [Methylibium sp.]|nr:hypothetical protein [Methylibium sp.]